MPKTYLISLWNTILTKLNNFLISVGLIADPINAQILDLQERINRKQKIYDDLSDKRLSNARHLKRTIDDLNRQLLELKEENDR